MGIVLRPILYTNFTDACFTDVRNALGRTAKEIKQNVEQLVKRRHKHMIIPKRK